MRSFWRNKSNKKNSVTSPDSDSLLDLRSTQQGTLRLPTSLEEVVRAAHTGVPSHLPGEEASQDEVRYFLYQILTLKEYKIALVHPQWVLETCMCWSGDGTKLRALSPNSFQQLCPLSPGYATINWRVKGCKFERQQIPPCEVRYAIGDLVRRMVIGLKTKETGNRRPGWQISSGSRNSVEVLPDGVGRFQGPTSHFQHKLRPLSFTAPAELSTDLPLSPSLHDFTSQPLPLRHQTQPLGIHQVPMYMHHQTPAVGSQYGVFATRGPRKKLSAESFGQQALNKGSCGMSPPGSPISSYRQAESVLSRLSESTARTSPPNSESEPNSWSFESDRARSTAPSITSAIDSVYTLPGPNQVSGQRAATATPSRYKACASIRTTKLDCRAYNPAHRLEYLRSRSYIDNPASHTPSEATLNPSDSATNKLVLQRDSAMSPSMTPSSFYSPIGSDAHNTYSIQSHSTTIPHAYVTVHPISQKSGMPQMGSTVHMMRPQSVFARSENKFQVDDQAFDSAEYVGLRARSARMQSLMVESDGSCGSDWYKNEGELNQHINTSLGNVKSNKEPTGLSTRFQNLRAGQPRLTVYGNSEGRERLGKKMVNSRATVDTRKRRGLTMYEVIEEKESLDGKLHGGVDMSAEKTWTSYF